MKEDNNSDIANLDMHMPTEDEQMQLKMALGRASRPEPNVDAEWNKFIGSKSSAAIIKRMAWLGAAAAVALVVFLLTQTLIPNEREDAYVAIGGPRKQVTIETAGNAPVVIKAKHLDFSQTNANVETTAQKEIEKTSIATSRGMDFGLTLPDGTEVWLNAESRITFPNEFSSAQREVEIEGEAYFDVVKDDQHPFIVHTKYFTTKVLGTSFDVKAYRKETAHVVLVSGKVEVTAYDKHKQTLSMGEMASFGNDGQMQKTNVDTYSYIQWKDGFFYFDRTPLGDIMRELGRWYDINIVFEDPSLMNVKLHFVAEKSQSINDIVKSLDTVAPGKVTLGDNEITIEK